jgi:hypothetical protein
MERRLALELIDAHLDGERLADADVDALTAWMEANERHADDAFRRILLHACLRHQMQALALAPEFDARTIALEQPPVASPVAASRSRRLPVALLATAIALCAGAVLLPLATRWLLSSPAHPFAHESFAYPAHAIPGSVEEWPTTGGLDGVDGGQGFAGPWQECGSLVAIVEANPADHPWRPNDLRQFGLLGYSDRFGHVLACSGNQLRTSAGPQSITRRMLNASAAPERLRDGDAIGADGSGLWISFLAQSFDSSGSGRYAYLQLGDDDAGLRIGKLRNVPSGDWSAAAVTGGVEINVRASDKPSGEAVLIVARIDFRPGPEQATIWINPDLGREPADSDSALRLPVPDFRLRSIAICGRYSTDFDEIRLGGRFGDVTQVVTTSETTRRPAP